MAIEFARTHVVGRSAGHTAIKAAAYRAGERLFDARTGLVADYSHRADEVRHAKVLLPAGADPALADRTTLWNAVESREDRHNRRAAAQLAKDHIVALPRELSPGEQVELARAFAAERFVSRGLVVDLAIHDHSEGNPHAHLLTTTRALDGADFGPKVRDENGAFLGGAKIPDAEQLRHDWAMFQNRWLRQRDIEEHVHVFDRERYRAESHTGPGHAMERRAVRTRRGAQRAAAVDARTRTVLEHPEIVIDRVADRKSLFTRHELYREAHKLVADPEAFAHLRAKLDAHPSLHVLRDPADGHRELLTTDAVLALERRVRRTGETLGRVEASVAIDAGTVDAALAAHPRLSDEQRAAVRHAVGGERIAMVVGLAGAGKSSMLAAVRDANERVGRPVRGLALAGKAADELGRSAGIDAVTIASWQLALETGRAEVEAGAVYVIDEAGMVGNRTMLGVLDAIERGGAKAILVGDAEQLQAIRAGCPFRDLARQEGCAEIGTIRRQRDAWQREATAHLARGRTAEAVAAHDRAGRVHRGGAEAMAARLVADYLDANAPAGSKAILAHRTDSVRALNDAVREARRAAGELGPGRPFHRGDASRDARGEGGERAPIDLEIGDRVRFETTDSALGIVAGRTGTWVGETDGVHGVIVDGDARDGDTRDGAPRTVGDRVDFRPDEYGGVRHVLSPAADTIEIAVGDRVLFARNDRTLDVRNGQLGTVAAFDGTVATVRTDDGRTVDVDDRDYPHLEHGYATTVHKAQGMTVERAFVLGQGSMDRHVGYVAMSRHRERLDVYLPDEEFETRSFAETISRARRQESALDLARDRGLDRAVEAPAGVRDAPPRGADDDGPRTSGSAAAPVRPVDGAAPDGRDPDVADRVERAPAVARTPGTADPDPGPAPEDIDAAERVIETAAAHRLDALEREHRATGERLRQAADEARAALAAHDDRGRGWFGLAARRRARAGDDGPEARRELVRAAERATVAVRAHDRDRSSGRSGREAVARRHALEAHPVEAHALARRSELDAGRDAWRSLLRLERLRDDAMSAPGAMPTAGIDRDVARLAAAIERNAVFADTLGADDRAALARARERAELGLERARSRGLER